MCSVESFAAKIVLKALDLLGASNISKFSPRLQEKFEELIKFHLAEITAEFYGAKRKMTHPITDGHYGLGFKLYSSILDFMRDLCDFRHQLKVELEESGYAPDLFEAAVKVCEAAGESFMLWLIYFYNDEHDAHGYHRSFLMLVERICSFYPDVSYESLLTLLSTDEAKEEMCSLRERMIKVKHLDEMQQEVLDQQFIPMMPPTARIFSADATRLAMYLRFSVPEQDEEVELAPMVFKSKNREQCEEIVKEMVKEQVGLEIEILSHEERVAESNYACYPGEW